MSKFQPCNRYVLIERAPRTSAAPLIELPEGFKPQEARHEMVTIKAVACDTKPPLGQGDHAVVLINYLVGHRHTSTLEHSLITFRFVVPLFIRSQHHRHRTWSYNAISRRYTDVDLQFYSPKEYREQSKSNRQASTSETFIPRKYITSLDMHMNLVSAVNTHHKDSLLLYNNLLDAGASREQARGILPQNLYTQYYGTANLNNILKFIDLRKHEGAQWEMQKVANAVLQICEQLYPITVNAWKKCTNTSSDTTKLS